MLMNSATVSPFMDQEFMSGVEQGSDRLVPSRAHRADDPELYRRVFSALDLDDTAAVSVIGVVSAIRGEGRTTIASRLAMTLAMDLDRHVWLVEADLQQPSYARLFNVDSGPGLCAVLEGTQELEAVAYPVAKNFSLVPAGTANGNAGRLLRRLATQDLFHQASALDGMVILDLPPLLHNSYGALVARIADATLLVVRAGVSPVHVVREAMALLDHQPPKGIIFNDFHSALPRWWPGQKM
jgi:Mrp family chromosome partitioning ATPase